MCNTCSNEKGAVGAFVCFGSVVTTSLFCVLNVTTFTTFIGHLESVHLV